MDFQQYIDNTNQYLEELQERLLRYWNSLTQYEKIAWGITMGSILLIIVGMILIL